MRDFELVPADPESEVTQVAYLAAHGLATPTSFKEAVEGYDADEWWKAMYEKINMLKEWGTWVTKDLPEGRKAIGCRWTYVIKTSPQGEILCYKARLVAQGFSQIPGINFSDTFSPTVRLDSLRAILHLAAAHGWARGQDNVTGAFLHSDIGENEVIYMKQPVGFEDGTRRLVHLQHELYRLKQALRLWNKHMDSKLTSVQYHSIPSDTSIYVRRFETGFVILAIHVNNIMSFADSEHKLERTHVQLHGLFEMKREDPCWLMGFQLVNDREARTVSILHQCYIETVLERFNHCKGIPDAPFDDPVERGHTT